MSKKGVIVKFTFHYVSIKSLSVIVYTPLNIIFTFHYVSIKSVSRHATRVSDS